MRNEAIAVCVIAAAFAAHAQTIQPPLLGMVLDRSAARMRPVFGVPGAATLGATLDTGNDIHGAAVAAGGRYALVLSGAASNAGLLFFDGPAETALADVPGGVSQVALSPVGSAAALYYESEHAIRTVSGLPSAPGPALRFDLSALPAASAVWAVSDDGEYLLYAGGTSEVFVLGGESGFRRIATGGVPSALAFVGGSHDAIVATPDGTALISNASNRPELRSLSVIKVPAVPLYIGLSQDGSQGLLIGIASGHTSVERFHSDGTSNTGADSGASALDCHCDAISPQRTAGSSAFILSDYTGKPLPLLDAGADALRITFVPPALDSDRLP
jgi:hypothetical protein